MRIAVVGAGIGGLSTAVGLQRAGAQVTVIERAPSLRPGGSGLSLFANGTRALAALGCGPAFAAIGSAAAAQMTGGQRRPDGSWVAVYPMDAVAELRIVERSALHAMLTDMLTPGTLRLATTATAAEPDGTLHLDGTLHVDGAGPVRERFDLIIAADGLRSRIRAGLADDPGIAYAGYGAWRGITAVPVELDAEAGETWGPHSRFGIAPLGDGRVYWFGVLSAAPDWQPPAGTSHLAAVFAGWHHPIPELIAATDPAAVTYLPIEELAGRLGSYVHGRVVLLGDAAHAMTPNLGQGGNQALEDAATLTALLTPLIGTGRATAGHMDAALQRYDQLRRGRTQHVAALSRRVGQAAHLPGPRLSALRDALMHRLPELVLRRQLSAVQDWQPPAG